MGFWSLVSLAAGIAGSLGGLFAWVKYNQAWRAGYQAGELAAEKRETERAKRRQRIDTEVGGLGPDELERRLRDGTAHP